MARDPMTLLQGTVDVLLLQTLAWDAMHGYAVSEWVRRHSSGALTLDDAALYQGLHRLEERGWVQAEWGLSENNRRARFYSLTARGRRQLVQARRDWQRYSDAVAAVLSARPARG